MILARLAVYGAILCTLWFNGSYAWSKGGSEVHQYGMVALALTIDLSKCGFLTAASHLWRNTWRVPATVLVLLWSLTFFYSTFSGFASITSNRTIITAKAEGAAQQRSRAQTNYDAAAAALNTAKASDLWTTTAACTAPKTSKQRSFCDNLDTTKSQQEAAAVVLNSSSPTHVDPEVTVLQDNTGLSVATLSLLIAIVPALILELVSSLGFYAIHRRPNLEATRKPAGWFSKWGRRQTMGHSGNAPTRLPDVSVNKQVVKSVVTSAPPPKTHVVDWTVP